MHQEIEAFGNTLFVRRRSRPPEQHTFATADEARRRRLFVEEGLSWVGTPFRDCAGVKGPAGAVDCATMMQRAAVDSGLVPPFDMPRYSPRWHQHRRRELFVEFIEGLGAKEVAEPRLGDVVMWQFGKTFSHGGILINSEEVVHSYYAAGLCLVSRRDESLLRHIPVLNVNFDRPVRYFSLWGQ